MPRRPSTPRSAAPDAAVSTYLCYDNILTFDLHLFSALLLTLNERSTVELLDVARFHLTQQTMRWMSASPHSSRPPTQWPLALHCSPLIEYAFSSNGSAPVAEGYACTRYLHMFILIDYFCLYSNGCSRRFCWRKCSQGKMRSFALFFLWHTTLGTRIVVADGSWIRPKTNSFSGPCLQKDEKTEISFFPYNLCMI